jgi:Uma2 family endonuclease
MVITLLAPEGRTRATVDPSSETSYLMATASEMNPAGGQPVEAFGGNIVVSPWSKTHYRSKMRSVIRQLEPHLPEGCDAGGEPFLFMFPGQGAFGPDIYVVDEALLETDAAAAPCEALWLVAEMTSNATRDNDRGRKTAVYGRSGIPVYLLFDMKDRALTVHSDPSPERGYLTRSTVPFGEPVRVPPPFGFELDTSAFAIPAQRGADA